MSLKHDIACIDIKSFYASVECVTRNLNPLTTKLCVVGDVNREGSVCLASSPIMKEKYKIKTGSRLYEIKNIDDPEIVIVQSRMAHYIKISKEIVQLFLRYIPETHLHVYSIDESWLTYNGFLNGKTPYELTQIILDDIYDSFGLIACAGIGDNKFLAKCILEVEGKKKGIAICRIEDVPQKLYPLSIEKMWGVGRKMKKHLNGMGIFTFKTLAEFDSNLIKKRFGKNGLILQQYANGIDYSPVIYNADAPPNSVFGLDIGFGNKNPFNIGRGVTLLEDYIHKSDILLVIRDLVDEVAEELRSRWLTAKTVQLSVGYSRTSSTISFTRQKKYQTPTSLESELYERCKKIFLQFYKPNEPIRIIRVNVGDLEDDVPILLDGKQNQEKQLAFVKDAINKQFGRGTIRRASSFTEKSIVPKRVNKTKGHF